MSAQTISGLSRTFYEANVWLGEIPHELGIPDEQVAYPALLTVDEALDLAAQLPKAVRGLWPAPGTT